MIKINHQQTGSVLLLCLVILTLTTITLVSTISQSVLQIRMIANDTSREIAFNTTKSEIISQYNHLYSKGIHDGHLSQAASRMTSTKHHRYEPIDLPRRGQFIYPKKKIAISSQLQQMPSEQRFNHRLSNGYTLGSTKNKRFKILTSSFYDENIQSKQEVYFDYRVRSGD